MVLDGGVRSKFTMSAFHTIMYTFYCSALYEREIFLSIHQRYPKREVPIGLA